MLKILFVGDIFPGNMPYSIGQGIASKFSVHQGAVWNESIQKLTKRADLTIGNLEAPLLNNISHPDNVIFAGENKFAKFLHDIGIRHVSIANNHIMEHGIRGFNSTIEILNEHAIKTIGYLKDGEPKIVIEKIKDISIGMVSFSAVYDNVNYRSYSRIEEKSINKAIALLNVSNIDIKIIGLHWGAEFCSFPSYQQVKYARHLIDLGFDIIWGHHPHVIQPIEFYKSGIIMYSLGNFLFDMFHSNKTRVGIASLLSIEKEQQIKLNIINYNILNDYSIDIKKEGNHLYQKNEYKLYEYKIISIISDLFYNLYSSINRYIHRILMQIDFIKNYHSKSQASKINYFKNLRNFFFDK